MGTQTTMRRRRPATTPLSSFIDPSSLDLDGQDVLLVIGRAQKELRKQSYWAPKKFLVLFAVEAVRHALEADQETLETARPYLDHIEQCALHRFDNEAEVAREVCALLWKGKSCARCANLYPALDLSNPPRMALEAAKLGVRLGGEKEIVYQWNTICRLSGHNWLPERAVRPAPVR